MKNKKTSIMTRTKLTTVNCPRISRKAYRALMSCGEKAEDRKAAAQKLVDYLCDKFEIPRCKVWVADRMPSLRKGGLKSGIYYENNKVMTIWNNEDYWKPRSNESFANTVLHEFMHHYDLHYLKLKKSLHTERFYARLQDLTDKLACCVA